MSFPFHPSMGEPDQHSQSPGGSFYGAQTPYPYQQQREEYLDMNMAYGNHGYNHVRNENDNNVADTGNGFPHDMNESNNNMADGQADGDNDDTKENMNNTADANVNSSFASVMDILNQLNEKDSDFPAKSDGGDLLPQPVLPGSSGEGSPYAPEDWPNPGDKWGWRVGRRVSSTGFFCDRFLYLPKSLQGFSSPKQPFASKPSIQRYIVENFPDADVNAFFASFTWKIQATEDPTLKVQPISFAPDVKTQVETEGIGTLGKEETPMTQGRGKRKAAVKAAANIAAPPYTQVETEGVEAAPTTSRKGRRKVAADSSATPKQKRASVGHNNNAGADSSATPKHKATTRSSTAPKRKTRQYFQQQAAAANDNDGTQAPEEEPPIDPVEFDKYLNSLDDIITQPTSLEIVNLDNTYASEHEIMQARIKLSSLLNMDFPSLFRTKKLAELTDLASKIRKDPSLSAEQLVKLKLIEEIPMYSEVFLENRQIAEQAEQFFVSLEANKAKVATLRSEYSELKEQATQLQNEVDYSLSAVQEIDEQIALLRSQRDRLTTSIEDKKRKKTELNTSQNVVANSIPKVVQEIQQANSKRPEWELKKENAAKREAEILDKFIPLKGFCL